MKTEMQKAKELVARDTKDGIFLCEYELNGVKYNLYAAHTRVRACAKSKIRTGLANNTLNDGLVNTLPLKDVMNYCEWSKKEVPTFPIAHAVGNCTELGFDDWYLASVEEVKVIVKATGNLIFKGKALSSSVVDDDFISFEKNKYAKTIHFYKNVYPIRRVKV